MASAKQVFAVLVPATVAIGAVMAIATGGVQTKREATIPAGTTLVATLGESVSTESSHPGTPVSLRTMERLQLDGENALPADLAIRGEVTHAKGGGRLAGAPELTLRFHELEVEQRDYAIDAEPFRIVGKDDAGETLGEIGGGAIGGGILGGIVGGHRGAAKGAVIGTVLGTGVAVATEGDQIVLPAGQKVRVRLTSPVTVQYRPSDSDDDDEKT